MKVIVGSSDIELSPAIVYSIAGIIAGPGADEPVGIRVSRYREPASPLERIVRRLCGTAGRPCQEWIPEQGGRSSVFRRDYEMVAAASSVYAYFSTDRDMAGGTGHVVKAALDREIQVEAWGVDPTGELHLIGSIDGRESAASALLYQMLEEATA